MKLKWHRLSMHTFKRQGLRYLLPSFSFDNWCLWFPNTWTFCYIRFWTRFRFIFIYLIYWKHFFHFHAIAVYIMKLFLVSSFNKSNEGSFWCRLRFHRLPFPLEAGYSTQVIGFGRTKSSNYFVNGQEWSD